MASEESEVQASAGTGEFSMPGQIDGQFEKFADFVDQYSGLISLKGIFFASTDPEPVGSQLVVDFRLIDGFRLFNALGEVAWIGTPDEPVSLNGQAVSGMGIRFQALDAKGRNLIVRVLEEHVNMGGEPFEVESVPPVALLDIPGVAAPVEPGQSEFLLDEPELQAVSEETLRDDDEPELILDEEIELIDDDPFPALKATEADAAPAQDSSSEGIEQQLADLAAGPFELETTSAAEQSTAEQNTSEPNTAEQIAGDEFALRLDSVTEETGAGFPTVTSGEQLAALLADDSPDDMPPDAESFTLELEEGPVASTGQSELFEAAAAEPAIHRLKDGEESGDSFPDLQWDQEIPGLGGELPAAPSLSDEPQEKSASPPAFESQPESAVEQTLDPFGFGESPPISAPVDADPSADPWLEPVAADRLDMPAVAAEHGAAAGPLDPLASKERIEDSIVEPGSKPIPPRPSSGELSVPASEALESPLEETQDSYVAWQPEGYGSGGISGGVAQRARSARPQLLAVLLVLVLATLGWLYRDTLMGWAGQGETAEPRVSRPTAETEQEVADDLASPLDGSAADPAQEVTGSEPLAVAAAEGTEPASGPSAGAVVDSQQVGTATAQPGSGTVVGDSQPTGDRAAGVTVTPPLQVSTPVGQPASALESITWEQESGSTVVRLVGNGDMSAQPLKLSRFRSRVRPRDLLVLSSFDQPFRDGTIRIGNGELERIRVGFHPESNPAELHVVFDLASGEIETSEPRVNGSAVELTFRQR